jgi:hypothetical protein
LANLSAFAGNLLFLDKYLRVNKKWLPYLIIAALGIVLFVIKRFTNEAKTAPKSTNNQRINQRAPELGEKGDPASGTGVNRNHGFDRRVSYIEYTQHAKCRMQCRKISQAEVEEIMQNGKINYNKSDVNARPCPSYALEGTTQDDQRVRIVFGQCDLKTKVITCIDLGTDWECHCPGDDDKYKNRK